MLYDNQDLYDALLPASEGQLNFYLCDLVHLYSCGVAGREMLIAR